MDACSKQAQAMRVALFVSVTVLAQLVLPDAALATSPEVKTTGPTPQSASTWTPEQVMAWAEAEGAWQRRPACVHIDGVSRRGAARRGADTCRPGWRWWR